MKLYPKVPTHARKRCPKGLSKKPMALGDRAIRSSKYFCDLSERGNFESKAFPEFPEGRSTSFKVLQDLSGGNIEIAPRARVRVRKKRMAAAAVKRNRETVHPDHPRGIYTKNFPPGVSGPWAGVSG